MTINNGLLSILASSVVHYLFIWHCMSDCIPGMCIQWTVLVNFLNTLKKDNILCMNYFIKPYTCMHFALNTKIKRIKMRLNVFSNKKQNPDVVMFPCTKFQR